VSEFRQNPITKQWVLIAPNRSKRPEDFKTYSVMHGLPEVDHTCVFCPGNEAKNAEILSIPQGNNWQLRVIKNKFEALEHTKIYQHKDFYNSRAGYGEHEVLLLGNIMNQLHCSP
jgi:UDPglucose--hexose-1-phosphate uridylyltransferase